LQARYSRRTPREGAVSRATQNSLRNLENPYIATHKPLTATELLEDMDLESGSDPSTGNTYTALEGGGLLIPAESGGGEGKRRDEGYNMLGDC
jgi:hypothetical protein